MPVVFVQTVAPIALSLSIDKDLGHYTPGEFSYIGSIIAGRWLSVMITIGAIVSQVGLANAACIVSDESLQSFLLRHNPEFFTARSKSNIAIVRWMFGHDFRVCPAIAAFDCGLLALMVNLPYNLLISSSMLIFCITVILLAIAYISLKQRNPDKQWYFRSWAVSIALSVAVFISTAAMMVLTIYDDYSLAWVPHINLVMFVAIVGLGAVLHACLHVSASAYNKRRHRGSEEGVMLMDTADDQADDAEAEVQGEEHV